MLSMILAIITGKFTLKFIFERLKYISKFSSMDYLNGNFNNFNFEKNARILTFFVRCEPRRKQ